MMAAACPAHAAAKPGLSAVGGDELLPSFDPEISTYAARCDGGSLGLKLDRARGWRASANGRNFGGDGRLRRIPVTAREDVNVEFRRPDGARRRFHVRCLPDDFPAYSFRRIRSGGPEYFFMQLPNGYAAAFDRNGVPVWWLQVDGFADDVKLLSDGTVSLNAAPTVGAQTGEFDIYSLRGELLRTVGAGDLTDVHDLLLRPNGNYVVGVQDWRFGVDTSAFNGYSDRGTIDYDIQELTPEGDLVRSWSSADHIGLDQTPDRWWEEFTSPDSLLFDVSHWNAVSYEGHYMYLSFRHLDAIYKVDRRTGEVVWKLGGLDAPESLEVKNDPQADYPLGGQHDVRALADGTVTVFNNRTDLDPAVPSAQRYRIDEATGTARLVENITDKKTPTSGCCGSARRLSTGDWLIAWGGFSGFVGGYRPDGRVAFRLRTPGGFTYRAQPVDEGVLDPGRVRRAMDAQVR